MKENKLHISNKSSVAIKFSLLIVVLIGLVVFIEFIFPIFANGSEALIWTTDVDGNNKTDFCPEEIVYIHGTGFNPEDDFTIEITRPDGEIKTSINIVREDGTFVYEYDLNGITGEYTVVATDRSGNSATTTFTDRVCNYDVACSSDTPCYNRCGDGKYWYYGSGSCSSQTCSGHCRYDDRRCNQTCGATCDEDSDCSNVCDGKKTRLGDCNSGCTCDNAAPTCVQGSCGATCDEDSDCEAGQICNNCECVAGARLNPQHDTYVRWYNSTNNQTNGNFDDDNIHVKWRVDSGKLDRRRSYFKFDLSGIPDGATITSATLRLSQFDADATNTIGVYKVSNDKTTGGAWTETDLTWNNAPIDWSTGATTSVDSSNGYKELSVATGDVQSALSGNILSLAVKFSDEVTSKHHDFCDQEGTGGECDSTTKPELVILYTVPPTQVCGNGKVEGTEQCDPPGDCCDTNCMFKLSSYECRQSAGECDIAEYCTGSSANCPADGKSTAMCRDVTGDCDVAEYCNGINNDCPDDMFQPGTHLCRASQGVCDIADYCDGNSPTCPSDAKSTAVCRVAVDQCDAAESCNGINNDCPIDAKEPFSTPCDDGLWCSATDHCDENGNCVKLTDRDCSGNDTTGIATCDNNPDNYHPTWDFRNVFTSVCDEVTDSCTQGDATITHTCDYTNCNAECDQTHSCQDKCIGDVWNYNGICDSEKTCTCSYSTENCNQYDGWYCTDTSREYRNYHCDVSGCDYDVTSTESCVDADICTVDACVGEPGQAVCTNTFSDTIGPTTSNAVVDPYYNNGIFNVTATATDTCSNIKKSEYFVGRGLGSCGFIGTGTPMDPTDGNFDNKIENIKKDNVGYLYDGLNYICIQSQDVADNWGNCECAYYETDIIPPDCPYDIYLDSTLYPDEYLVCGNNAWLNATVCDEQSPIQGGEYFLDTKIPPIPAPWSGIWMNVLSSFTRPSDQHVCAVIGALVDTSKLTDGTHYIKLRGKDSVENWGKIETCMNVSFIRDTTPPETAKTLIPSEKKQHECSADEITGAVLPNGVSLTNGCQFVKGGTQIVLHATDPDPQGTNENADKTKIHWIVWYKVNSEDPWVIDQQGVGDENQDVTITLDKDSYHLIEYWSVDGCSWEETHHFELDIVDNKSPVTTKTIGEPKVSYSTGEWYITQQTPIELSCVDQNPHPVDHVTLYARYNVDGGGWVDIPTIDGYVKFTFSEDSIHTLEWYCVDELGNKELTYTEIDRVDTTYPETIKTYGTPLVETSGRYPKWISSQTSITLTATDGGAICAIGVDKTYWRNTLVDERYCADQNLCQEAEPSDKLVINEVYYDEPGTDYNEFIELFGPSNYPLDGYRIVLVNGATGTAYNTIDLTGHQTDANGFFLIITTGATYPELLALYDMMIPPSSNLIQNGPDDAILLEYLNQDLSVTRIDTLGYGPLMYPDLYETQPTIDVMAGQSLSRNEMHTDTDNNAVDFTVGAPTPKSGNSAPKWNEYTGSFTKPEESCHLIEYYSVDYLGNVEPVKKQCVYVENTPPQIDKTVDTPKHECTIDEKTQYGNPDYGCWYITQNTKITLDCDDVMPHPVDNVVLYYRDYLLGQIAPSYTAVPGGYVDIYKTEDSEHVLEFYCVDALGNSQGTAENPHKEIDIVDTQAPISSKAVGEPKHACTQAEVSQYYTVPTMPSDGCYFINQSTPITLTCADQSPHPVDHEKIYYRYFSSDLSLSGHCVGTPTAPCGLIGAIYGICDYGCYWSDGICVGTPLPNSCENYDYYSCADVGCQWELIEFTEVLDDEVTIYPGEDSAHVLQWYCVDELGNAESLHEEYDIVDTQAPSIVKSIVGPSYGDCLPTETDDQCFIDGVTKIHVESRDPSWHPSDHVTCDWDYTVTDGTKTGTGQTGVVPPFDINFPEESTHVLTITCKDALGNEETDVEKFIVDKTPPTTTKTYGTPLVEAVTGGYPKWITSQTPITLTVDDTGIHKSGIKETKYRVTLLGSNEPCEDSVMCQQQAGSGDWQTYTTTPFTIVQESCHLIEYYSVDNVNKTEIVKKQCVYVDNTPPEVSKEVGTPKVESTQMTEYLVPESYDVKDRAWFVNQSTSITLTCVDQNPHPVDQVEIYYKYYNDGQLIQDWTLYTSPFTYSEDTYHELYYYCVDALGNRGPTHYQLDIVDTQSPVSRKSFDGINIPYSQLACANESSYDNYITQDTKIILECADQNPHPVNDVKIYYRYFVDDVLHQDWTLYEFPIQYNEDSKHTLEWYCIDALGNKEETHTQIERVDSTPPVTTKTVGDPKYGENDYWVTSQIPITLTTVDEKYPCISGPATLYYEVWWDSNCDGTIDTKVQSDSVTTDINCNLEKTIYLNEECLHEIRWHAVDALGNVETEHIQLHKVDNTPPHILILKPVDGWYSDGEDIPIVAIAEDLTNPHGPCNPLSGMCNVGIENGRQCYAYLIDLLPHFGIVELQTEGTLLYNAEAHECQGYATIPSPSGIPDGITFLTVSADDNLGNMGNSLMEILHTIAMECSCEEDNIYHCPSSCIVDVIQDIVTIWNLPKIGIDNNPIDVVITDPLEGTVLKGTPFNISANISDSTNGEITSAITTGTPCYITLDGVSLGSVPYINEERKCSGTMVIPNTVPQGLHELKVEIADNAGNIGFGIINVIFDTIPPTDVIIWKDEEKKDIYYDQDGSYTIYWEANDANLDYYELFENDVSIYTGTDTEMSFNDQVDGTYLYYVIAHDMGGWTTKSNEITIIVDSQNPDIEITGIVPGIGFFIATYTVSDPTPSSGIDKIVSSTDGYVLCSGTFPTGFCTVFLGSQLDLTVYDKAGNEDTASTTGSERDITPPTIVYSSPSGVIDYSAVTLEVKTDEPSTCYYGSDDNNETMTLMTADAGMTTHTANLGTLTDGFKVYHVMCEDLAGNKMDSSKTIVFYIDTTGSYNLVIPDFGHYWSTGWNTFFLPESMLDDICGNGEPYSVENVLSSLDGSDPSYDAVWYFDGTEWLFYDPKNPAHSTLTQFNDLNSLPYYIRLVREDRLEISQANCQPV
jgi:hypothetical protein